MPLFAVVDLPRVLVGLVEGYGAAPPVGQQVLPPPPFFWVVGYEEWDVE